MSALAPAPAPPLAPDAVLAPGFEVIAHLSRNQALDVYEVWSVDRGCSCVAKTLRPDRLDRERDHQRLLREGAILAELTHPNVVRAYETLAGPPPVVILETLEGETLEALIWRRRARRLTADDVVVLGLQLSSALHHLHRHGWLHLDVKPGNVVVHAGRAVLMDMSLARRPCSVTPGLGTDGYRPPEQQRGGEVTDRSDVFALGATLYRAATGRQVDGPVGRHRRLPARLAAAIDGCLREDPRARPSVAELADALDAA